MYTSTERQAYVELRSGTRGLLSILGVESNPMVGDEWIISWLRDKANLPQVEDYEHIEGDDFLVFKNSLSQIIRDLGKQLTVPEATDSIVQSTFLINALYRVYEESGFMSNIEDDKNIEEGGGLEDF